MDIKPEDVLPIVAKLSESYTSKESTSISFTTARQLMGAVLYCIEELDTDSKKYTFQNEAFTKQQIVFSDNISQNTFVLYEAGYQIVLEKTKLAKACYDSFIMTFNGYGNYFYEQTIRNGIPKFFLYYDPKFSPQDHLLTLDYTTLISVDDKCGIDAISQYLEFIRSEQAFLHCFTSDQIITILQSFDENYKELPINPCQIMYRYLLCREISHKKSPSLFFTEEETEFAKDYLYNHSRSETESHFAIATKSLLNSLHLEDDLYHYLTADITNFAAELYHTLKHNCLERFFYCG